MWVHMYLKSIIEFSMVSMKEMQNIPHSVLDT